MARGHTPDKPFYAYILTGATDRGVFKTKVQRGPNPGSVWFQGMFRRVWFYGDGKEWTADRDVALRVANEMRQAEIKRHYDHIDRLTALDFDTID